MGTFVETLVYVLEIFKYLIISYYVIGLKPSYKKRRVLLIPVVLLGATLVYFGVINITIAGIILGCAIIMLWYDENIRLSVFCIIFEFIALSFIDLLMWLMCVGMTPLGNNYTQNEVIVYLVGNLLGLLPWVLLGVLIRKKKFSLRNTLKDIKLRSYILIILIMLTLIIITACMQGIFLNEMSVSSQRLVVIVSVFFAVFVVVLCALYIYVVDSKNKLVEINNLDRECLEYQKNYYASVMKKDEELRAFKHDVNKHLNSLKLLCDDGRITEMSDYLKQLTSTVEQEHIYKTGNIIADYIINGIAKEILSKTDTCISIIGKFPQEMKMDNTEICIVLANILNNAKEALLEYQGEKKLELIIKNYKGRLFLTMRNSSTKRDIRENKTTKKDKENHGYGIKNVRRIVDKYEGSLEMKWENDVYTTEIML